MARSPEWWGPPLVQWEKYHEKPYDDDNNISVELYYLFACKLSLETICKVSSSKTNETTAKPLQTKYKTRLFI
jgi:hypothetical protein